MSLARRLAGGGSVLLVVALAAVAGNHLTAPGNLPLRDITVEGDLQRADRAEVWRRLRPLAGENFVSLRLRDVKLALLSDPWVERVNVQRVWPDRLVVTVKERVPVARWGGDSLLDASGVRFAADRFPRSDLPLLEGPPGSERRLLATYRGVDRRLRRLGLEVDSLIQDSRRAWRIVLRDGFELNFGRQAFQERLDRFINTYPGLLAPRADAVALVDLRYSNGFAVRWRQADVDQPG